MDVPKDLKENTNLSTSTATRNNTYYESGDGIILTIEITEHSASAIDSIFEIHKGDLPLFI